MSITKLSFGESLQITLFAMGMVFILLVFIAFIIRFESRVVDFIINKTKKKANPNVEVTETKQLEEKHEEIEEIDKNSECETVAAIMAALSEYIDVPIDKLNVKSIKRVNNNLWRQTSLRNSLK